MIDKFGGLALPTSYYVTKTYVVGWKISTRCGLIESNKCEGETHLLESVTVAGGLFSHTLEITASGSKPGFNLSQTQRSDLEIVSTYLLHPWIFSSFPVRSWLSLNLQNKFSHFISSP